MGSRHTKLYISSVHSWCIQNFIAAQFGYRQTLGVTTTYSASYFIGLFRLPFLCMVGQKEMGPLFNYCALVLVLYWITHLVEYFRNFINNYCSKLFPVVRWRRCLFMASHFVLFSPTNSSFNMDASGYLSFAPIKVIVGWIDF